MKRVIVPGRGKYSRSQKFSNNSGWFLLFKKSFNISKIEKALKCDGIKILEILYKLNKIEDKNLRLFIEMGYVKKLCISKNKEVVIHKFLLDSTKNKPQRRNSFNTLRWIHNSKDKREPDINIIVPLKLAVTRGATKSKTLEIKTVLNLSYRKKIWVSVGINNYKNWQKLTNATSDAIKITEFAKDHDFITYTLLNEQATKNNIEKIFKDQLYRELDSDDLLIFSFHGHGTNIFINNRGHGFIVPYEASLESSPYELISIEEFTSWIRFLKCKHVLLLFDCCFSGFAVLRGTGVKSIQLGDKSSSNETKTRRFSEITIHKILSQKNRIAITAGTSDQQVSDGGWGDNSAFTGLIIAYPGFKTCIGSIFELYTYLLINVPKYSNQTPCIGKLIGDEGGDIFLSL